MSQNTDSQLIYLKVIKRLQTSLMVFIVLYSVKCFPLDVQELYKFISWISSQTLCKPCNVFLQPYRCQHFQARYLVLFPILRLFYRGGIILHLWICWYSLIVAAVRTTSVRIGTFEKKLFELAMCSILKWRP